MLGRVHNPQPVRLGRVEGPVDEVVGRFKLSQDRSDADRRRAALALARHTEAGERNFIERMVGLHLTPGATADAQRRQEGGDFHEP